MAIEDKDTTDLSVAPTVGPDDPRRFTDSGIEIKPLYTEGDLPEDLDLGEPGEFPFPRGIHAEMYRKRRWTMRQYAGYASARESNERYKYLLQHGSTGLSMAFDLPTQLGLDSDDPRCLGEVGRTGVAIDTLDDMRTAFDGIPLDEVSTSMTINAPAAVLLLLYQLVGEEQGVPPEKLRGTVQNDILKEYIARGNFIYPPGPSMRLTTDLFAYCAEHVPRWNTCSISGYHFREKGCSAVQEVAFAPVCGGTQSLHTNGYDEALALPTERAAKLALRTQQIVAHESGAADTVDPFAGSYFVEALTDEIEQRAWRLIDKVDELGGSVEAIAFIKGEIEESAFGYHERYRTKQDIVVGVIRFVEDDAEVEDILRVDPATERG